VQYAIRTSFDWSLFVHLRRTEAVPDSGKSVAFPIIQHGSHSRLVWQSSPRVDTSTNKSERHLSKLGERNMDDKDKGKADTSTDAGTGTAGSTLGGAVAGAVAGTALGLPVVGTVIGALSGAAIGAARKRTTRKATATPKKKSPTTKKRSAKAKPASKNAPQTSKKPAVKKKAKAATKKPARKAATSIEATRVRQKVRT
jgi:hypothetical protein